MAKNVYKVISVFFHEKYCILTKQDPQNFSQRPISGRLRARSMTLIMGVYGISEVLVNIEDKSH